MKIFKYIKTLSLVFITALMLTSGSISLEKVSAEQIQTIRGQITASNTINPMNIVKAPSSYLNKEIVLKGKFDKFSTLGLDYKSAYKSSDDYISFLIKRNDTSHDIPLSEMKLFLKREMAEKFIDLKTNDEIEVKGLVFSDALGDAWIEVSKITIISKAQETDKNGDN